ncbi:MAG: glycosyltransferase family 2 protein [Candidatus Poribacteria bacterium]
MPHAMDQIDIHLATYNGAAFLNQQLGTVENQTHRNWRLVIRDDGSTDKTPEIIEAFRARHPEKIVVLRDEDGNLGLVQNFSRLMEHAGAGYVAFCDQDDIWKPEKLELSLQKMRDMEAEHGADKPLLVFTDLTVVDEDLRNIHPSFWCYQGVRPDQCNTLGKVLFQNVVTGCTALMNRPLVEKSMPIPGGAVVHDWWVALVAVAFGAAGYIAQPTVLYRQHRKNILGARDVHVFNLPARGSLLWRNYSAKKDSFSNYFRQADAFYVRFCSNFSDTHRQSIATFLQIPHQKIFGRISHARRCGCLPYGILRKAVFLALCRGASG